MPRTCLASHCPEEGAEWAGPGGKGRTQHVQGVSTTKCSLRGDKAAKAACSEPSSLAFAGLLWTPAAHQAQGDEGTREGRASKQGAQLSLAKPWQSPCWE